MNDPSNMEILICDEYILLSTYVFGGSQAEIDQAYEYSRLTWGDELFPPYHACVGVRYATIE